MLFLFGFMPVANITVAAVLRFCLWQEGAYCLLAEEEESAPEGGGVKSQAAMKPNWPVVRKFELLL